MMDDEKWRKLMADARWSAHVRNARVAVVAVELGSRAAAHLGTRWAYVITTVQPAAPDPSLSVRAPAREPLMFMTWLREVADPIDTELIDAILGYEALSDGEVGCGHLAKEIEQGKCKYTNCEELPALRAIARRYGHG